MPLTGEVNWVPGIYRSTHCGKTVERAIPKGHLFPSCEGCHQRVEWALVRKTETPKPPN